MNTGRLLQISKFACIYAGVYYCANCIHIQCSTNVNKKSSIQITINISSLADLYLSLSFISPMCVVSVFFYASSLFFCSFPFFHLFSVSSKSYCRNGSFPELLLSLLSNWKRSIKPRPAVSYTHCRRDRAPSVCVSLSEQNECALCSMLI